MTDRRVPLPRPTAMPHPKPYDVTYQETSRPAPHQETPCRMTYQEMLEKVRYDGAYPTRERADEAVRLVLAGLGRQLSGDERVELAARLPFEAARVLTGEPPSGEPLTGWAFVKELASRTGATPATVRWDTGAVLGAVALLAGPELLTRVIGQLPSGYALLFGRAELVQAA